MNTTRNTQIYSTVFIISIFVASFFLAACTNTTDIFDATGTFEAREVLVGAEGTGRILSLNAEEGQAVKAGEELGRIDSVQLELKRRQLLAMKGSAESRRTDADIQTAAIEQQIQAASVEKVRIEGLLKADAANKKQLDDINAQLAVLEKQKIAQRTSIANGNRGLSDELQSLDIQIEQLNDQIEKCRIVSPIAGTILVRYAEAGEITGMAKALFKVADLDSIFLRSYVTADQLSRLKLGQALTVIADFGKGEGKSYAGKITWISDKSEFTPKTIQTKDERANLVYAVKIALVNDGYLKIGMYGKVLFNKE